MEDNTNHTKVICGVCGEIRMNTPSGSVCPNGHGKMMPKVPRSAYRLYERYRESLQLPQAEFVDGKPWTFDVEGARYVRASEETKKIRAGLNGNVIRLKPAAGSEVT